MGNLRNFNEKIHYIRYKIKILERKQRSNRLKKENRQRRERARRLLKLGLIFEMTFSSIYSPELLVGYLLGLQTIGKSEKEELQWKGNEILSQRSLETHDAEEVYELNYEERKKRNHKLISLGALIEITKTEEYSLAVLTAYLSNLHERLSRDKQKYYEEIGNEFLLERRRK